jgi:hypothetical protein
MALIKCPDCGAEVSDAAPACPRCGRPADPIVAPNGSRQRTPQRERNRTGTVSITLSSFALLIIGFALAVCFVPALQIGQHVEARCQVNGLGSGTCQFTNTGWTPGSQCVAVRLVNKQGGAVSSGPLCSGRIWPNDTAQRDVAMVIGDNCSAPGVMWNDACTMDIRNLTAGDDGESSGRDSPTPRIPPAAPTQAAAEAAPPTTAAAPKAPALDSARKVDELFRKMDRAAKNGAADEYAAAIQATITPNWVHQDNLPLAPCEVHITQLPGGAVVSAVADDSCPYDTAGKISVENAVLRSQPLPYKGFEGVFQRNLTMTFSAK